MPIYQQTAFRAHALGRNQAPAVQGQGEEFQLEAVCDGTASLGGKAGSGRETRPLSAFEEVDETMDRSETNVDAPTTQDPPEARPSLVRENAENQGRGIQDDSATAESNAHPSGPPLSVSPQPDAVPSGSLSKSQKTADLGRGGIADTTLSESVPDGEKTTDVVTNGKTDHLSPDSLPDGEKTEGSATNNAKGSTSVLKEPSEQTMSRDSEAVGTGTKDDSTGNPNRDDTVSSSADPGVERRENHGDDKLTNRQKENGSMSEGLQDNERHLSKQESDSSKELNPLPGATEAGSDVLGAGDVPAASQSKPTVPATLDDEPKPSTTQRGASGKKTNSRQSKQDGSREADQKPQKRTPSRSPKTTPRTAPERKPATKDDKSEKKNNNEKQQRKTLFKTPAKSGILTSKAAAKKDIKSSKEAKHNSAIGALISQISEPGNVASTDRTDQSISGKEETKSKPETKPANGIGHNAIGGKALRSKDETGTVSQGQRKEQGLGKKQGQGKEQGQGVAEEGSTEGKDGKKGGALLGRSMMRRLTTKVSDTTSNNTTTTTANTGKPSDPPTQATSPLPPAASHTQTGRASVDLNSSAGSKSLPGSFASPSPVGAHKTQSMQSLAVPLPGALGPTPLEADDRISVGSRRDSVRHSPDSVSRRSVDYRGVVTGAGAEDRPKSVQVHDDSVIRAAIPALPVSLAVVCLVFNIIVPGFGTLVGGLSVVCGSKPRLSNKGDGVASSLCINLCVAAAQLGTVTFLLVGWFWSLAWGVKMVQLAVQHRTEQRQQREKELQALALRAFGSPGNIRRSMIPPV